jgi:putative peptide zinc metalloprotease protein
MAGTLFSPSWYRVAGLKPRLRAHVEIHRHSYRDAIWFILQDHSSGRSHRLTPAAYAFIGLMDGTRTVQNIWDLCNERTGNDAPTQDDVVRLLGQLHAADALICDVPPDTRELFRRFQRQRLQTWRQRLWTPLAIRIPLFDPDSFLERTAFLVRPLFGRLGALIWLSVVAAGLVLAGLNWSALSENVIDRVLAPQNLLLLWFVYPIVKAIHELGHAYATKIYGGEVHEVGVMFLVFVPVPYVDASAASSFPDKRQRMVVGAIGIGVEMLLAAVAVFVFANATIGPVHAVAYNIILIGGVSTVLFNGNPLLRFDGYYVLADAIELPNLSQRAIRYLGYLVERYAFGSREASFPETDRRARVWFVFYGIASFFYRLFISIAIMISLGSRFFIIGVLLLIWAGVTQLIIPVGKSLSFLSSSPRLQRNRRRAIAVTALAVGLAGLIFFVIPFPLRTVAEGITWPSERSQVRAGTDGFIERLLVADGSQVEAGQPLIKAYDPFLDARVAVLEAQLRGLLRQYTATRVVDQAEAAVLSEEIKGVRSDLDRGRERQRELVINSPRAGMFVAPVEEDMPGRFVKKGQLVGFVIDASDRLTARTMVDQNDIALVRERTLGVDVFPVHWEGKSATASIVREVPEGLKVLPTPALGTMGGGNISIDPRDSKGVTALDRYFEYEIALPAVDDRAFIGQRVKVRFDHGTEPIGFQVYRLIRQVFLRLFDV